MINENCMKCVENRFTNLTEMQTIASLEIASLLLSFFLVSENLCDNILSDSNKKIQLEQNWITFFC